MNILLPTTFFYLTFCLAQSYAIDTTVVNPSPENFEISWPSSAGKSYTIKRSNELGNLSGQPAGHQATPPTNTLIIDSSENSDYFIQVVEDIDETNGERSAAYAMNKRLGKGNNFMASKIQFEHAYLSDFVLLRESGFDHCRIGSNLYKFYGDGSGDESNASNYEIYKAALKTAVDFALEAGLNAIVNPVHHWANDDDLNDNGVSYRYRFTGSPSDYIKYNAIWLDIANEFKDYPVDQVVFELMNEPHREYVISDVIENGLTQVRSIPENEKRIVLIAGAYGRLDGEPINGGLSTREALIDAFDSDLFNAAVVNDPYLIGTFHYYDPRPFTRQGNTTPGEDGVEGNPGERWGTQSAHYQDVIDAFDAVDTANNSWASRNGTIALPIYQGEFGVDNAVDDYGNNDRKKWLSWVRMQCEKRGYSWCHWHMYNNDSNAKGLGPFDTSTLSDSVYFDFDEFVGGGIFTYATDKVYGSSSNSTWGINANKGFTNLIPSDGVFRLNNDGSNPQYAGLSGGNTNRAEWGLTYHGFGATVDAALRGKIDAGFDTTSGKFTIECNIDGWNLTGNDEVTVKFQGRDQASGKVISGLNLVGKTIDVTETVGSSLVNFSYDGGSINDSATNASTDSLFALGTNFLPDTDGNDSYTIEKETTSQYFGGNYGPGHRTKWGLEYSGNQITQGFNKSDGVFVVELEISEFDLSNGANPQIEFQLFSDVGNMIGKLRIKAMGGHTRLWHVFPDNSQVEHRPLNDAGGNRWAVTGLFRGGETSGGLLDPSRLVRYAVDLDNDTITITSQGVDQIIDNAGIAGATIDTVRLATNFFGSPDYITLDNFKIHDGSTTEQVIGSTQKTLVRGFGISGSAGVKFAEYELDSNSASGDSSHKLAVTVDYDTGEYTLSVDDNTVSNITGVSLDSLTSPLHSVRLVTSHFADPSFVDFNDVSFYEGNNAPYDFVQTAEGLYGGNPRDMPELRYFDSEPLEALIGSYEFEDYAPSDILNVYKGYSGNGYLDLNQNNSLNILSVYKPRMSTDYSLKIRYASSQNETIDLTVDGVTTTHNFPSTGSLYDWGEKSILISNANAGESTITISGNVTDSFNLDKAEITIE